MCSPADTANSVALASPPRPREFHDPQNDEGPPQQGQAFYVVVNHQQQQQDQQ